MVWKHSKIWQCGGPIKSNTSDPYPVTEGVGVCPKSSLTSCLDVLWRNKGHFACHFSKKYHAERGKIVTDLKLCRNKLRKILKEMGIPDHLTCLLRNLYAGQETTVRTGCGLTDWFQIGKGVHQDCILSPAYSTYMQSISREMLDWMKHKLELRFLGEISITSDMYMIPHLWQRTKN